MCTITVQLYEASNDKNKPDLFEIGLRFMITTF